MNELNSMSLTVVVTVVVTDIQGIIIQFISLVGYREITL